MTGAEIKALCCGHERLTASDDEKYAICENCGAVVPTELTLAMLNKTFDEMRKL